MAALPASVLASKAFTWPDDVFGKRTAGDAPIVVSRLLGAKPLRRLLADRQELDIALILSTTLFQDVVRTGFCSLDPADFQHVRINTKGVHYHGFVDRKAAGVPPGNDELQRRRRSRETDTDPIAFAADHQAQPKPT